MHKHTNIYNNYFVIGKQEWRHLHTHTRSFIHLCTCTGYMYVIVPEIWQVINQSKYSNKFDTILSKFKIKVKYQRNVELRKKLVKHCIYIIQQLTSTPKSSSIPSKQQPKYPVIFWYFIMVGQNVIFLCLHH